MKKDKNSTEKILEKIYEYSLEEIMGERFGRYSKYIIQDRAIPDVRDGLKPVQRRILYAMYIGHNTYDKPYRKSAKTVGDVIGSFHPHGDTSIYDAMVRLSQDWKIKNPLIEMHGNNGSIDGDSPAAYRYTEARLSKISNELLKDIDKSTVLFAPNFDDTILEPTVLPAKFPNLLVNGTTGISAGYATNIPPHNLGEVIDATIKRIDSPNCRFETIMEIIKGPDFPTGGIVSSEKGIKDAFTTGKGKVTVRSKVELIYGSKTNNLIITEIPYEVLKINIVKKIDEIRIEKRIDGIIEVRDESDKDGLRIVVELKKDAVSDLVLNYLYKNTELQTSYNYNMVAIVNRRPKLLGIVDIIDAYISHLKEVILNRTKFDLEHAKKRFHIVEGLVKAISILDEVIKVIRASKNKTDAKENLVDKFSFTMEQAEAIVTLQLYRLSNTDITLLDEELKNLSIIIEGLKKIINDEEELKIVIKNELRKIKKEYDVARKTEIKFFDEEIKIDNTMMIAKEDVIVLVTKDGYVKRTSKRSYLANCDDPLLKENDYVLGLYELSTLDTILLFTNLGNYLYLPVHEIPDIKWKVLGKHISNIIKIAEMEEIVGVLPIKDFSIDKDIIISSRDGMIKKTKLSEFKVNRYTKAINCMKLKENDEVIGALIEDCNDIIVSTSNGYNLWFDTKEIPESGIKSSGVKSISLKDDYVISTNLIDENIEYITVFTDKNTAKRIKVADLSKTTRAKKGIALIKNIKSNPHHLIKVVAAENKAIFGLKKIEQVEEIKNTSIIISDCSKPGMSITKGNVLDIFLKKALEKNDSNDTINNKVKEEPEKKSKNVQISLLEIDNELSKIDDILNK